MLYINNPEALVAIAEDSRTEFGIRSVSGPDMTGIDIAKLRRNRLRPLDHRSPAG